MSASTISVALSKELAEAHAARGQGYVAAPVLGRPEAAAAKKLWIMAAGPAPKRAARLGLAPLATNEPRLIARGRGGATRILGSHRIPAS